MNFSGFAAKLTSAAKSVSEIVGEKAQSVASASKAAMQWMSPHIYDVYKNFQTSDSSLVCVLLGPSGAGKTELVCVFDDLEKSFFGLAGVMHASGLGGETKKQFSTSGALPIGNDKILMSDGVGKIELLARRFVGIREFLERIIKEKKGSVQDGRLSVLCVVVFDLRDDFNGVDLANRFRAELRLFRRTVVGAFDASDSISIAPNFLVVGSHLDEVADAKRRQEALSEMARNVFDREQLSADCPYKVVVGDLYSSEGRRDFLQAFFGAKEEMGV